MQHIWDTVVDNVVCLLVLLPLMGACLVHVVSVFGTETIRRSVITNVLLTCGLAVVMVVHYNPTTAVSAAAHSSNSTAPLFQMISDVYWVAELGPKSEPSGLDIRFTVGVDGISLWFIVLTVLLSYAVIVGSSPNLDRPATYYSLVLLLESCLIGLFAALDVVLFCIFLELSMLPVVLLIGWWGGYQRRSAVKQLFLYNLLGSLFVMVGLVSVVVTCGWMGVSVANPNPEFTSSIPRLSLKLHGLLENGEAATYWDQFRPWIFICLLLGFVVKVPLVPFHRWLVVSNDLASWPVSALLSAIVIKVGAYGIVRFMLPLFPEMCVLSFDAVSSVVVVGTIFTALLAINQRRLRMLFTYAWISHVGFCLLGILTLNATGVTGGILQLVNHGVSAAALILLVGFFSQRFRTVGEARLPSFGQAPALFSLLLVTVFSLIGVPGLNGFVGETMVLFGVFRANPTHAAWSLFGLLLLTWAFVGRTKDCIDVRRHQIDVTSLRFVDPGTKCCAQRFRELASLAPLAGLMVTIGIYPQMFIDRIEPSVSIALDRIRILHEMLQ